MELSRSAEPHPEVDSDRKSGENNEGISQSEQVEFRTESIQVDDEEMIPRNGAIFDIDFRNRAEPVTTEPVTTKPVTTEPVTTEPVTTEPVTTEPVTTKPVTTKPVTTKPVTTEPVTTESVDGGPVEDMDSSGNNSTNPLPRSESSPNNTSSLSHPHLKASFNKIHCGTLADSFKQRDNTDIYLEYDTCEIQQCSDEDATANGESHRDILMRQQQCSRQQNDQNVAHIGKTEVDNIQERECFGNNTTQPPENQIEGVPYGGRKGQMTLYNTCSGDQFLNGIHQVSRFPQLKHLLIELAERCPESYSALLMCEKRQFTDAKCCLVPGTPDMLNTEGRTVMPSIEAQLRHWLTTRCRKCQYSFQGIKRVDIDLKQFNKFRSFQGTLSDFFSSRSQTCSQKGCDGKTMTQTEFESGVAPLILPINLYFNRDLIPNSQSIDVNEVLELFGKRYFMFLFTFVRPPDGQGNLGHYMSRVYRPDTSGEKDSQGRPVGRWYFYPNNESGYMIPWTENQMDPEGTQSSYVYFIQIPSSEAPSKGHDSPQNEGQL
ncbi:uncharacterized protein LOC132544901 isoform X2 [Ylistrum balloti]|uniref:uncharacterized protein LOC132544901 isoform X2 n=1 Tax=Ylistrum balloti TaxID=509963 RepID=UPI002905A4C9|nr:uncharacterized protein LOC132544901 isoform X2 [Ylistrum balloti]